VALSSELGDAGRLARQALLDLGGRRVVGDGRVELDEVLQDDAPDLVENHAGA
jgi:hypothetical protein